MDHPTDISPNAVAEFREETLVCIEVLELPGDYLEDFSVPPWDDEAADLMNETVTGIPLT